MLLCFWNAGYQAGFYNYNSAFIQYNFDGTIENLSIIENDTLGISFMPHSKMIKTLDGNFAHIAVAVKSVSPFSFIFVKMNSNGDTLSTNYFSEFYEDEGFKGKNPGTLIQAMDSTYYGIVSVQREDNLLVPILFIHLTKEGKLINYTSSYYGVDELNYPFLFPGDLLNYNSNRFIISGTLLHDDPDPEDKLHHPKIIVVDSLGEIIDERVYWDDLLSLDCNGLTKTVDNGPLYCGRNGTYLADEGAIRYIDRIVKLNSDLDEEREIELGEPTIGIYLNLHKIKAINYTEFLAVGYNTSLTDFQTGVLVKFNLAGEKIWERRYRKIPPFGSDLAEHQLFDVDITPDNGFVMVGQAINYNEPTEMPGQKGWLVKVDSFGCLVPGCEYINIGISENDYQSTPIYPNPATNYIFYYHHQDSFEPVEVKIYSTSGQIIQAWGINSNDITCEVDISAFEKGMYILSVTSKDGKISETQKFLKE